MSGKRLGESWPDFLKPKGFEKSRVATAGCKALLLATEPGPGEAGLEVWLKPRRLELARRAMRMFSSVRKEPSGERGEGERELSLETAMAARPRPVLEAQSEVAMGGSFALVLLLLWRGGDGLEALSKEATVPMLGVSFTIGEYWEIGEAPLKAPVVSAAGAFERLRPVAIVGDGSLNLPDPGGAGAARGWECDGGPLAEPEPICGEG